MLRAGFWRRLIMPRLDFFPRCYFPGGGPQRQYTWPTPDGEGPLIRPFTKLATLVAANTVFRERCGLDASDPYANEKLLDGDYGGRKSIFYPAADMTHWKVFPGVVLFFGNSWSWEVRAGGSKNYLRPDGELRLVVTDKDKYPGDIEKSMRDFGTFVGQFIEAIASQFAVSDSLAGNRIEQENAPGLAPLAEAVSQGRDYWMASYLITWGS